ncbi:MAG: hypothetical protein KAW56_13285 [Candidatus Marinimicrobia bacterium]|nr:hypothetical protein [Candidatus Neomarinimicrobiota bacterium]MCK4448040.1 hypothetical protein [Candidatus Neomarinimicrobiota bacterium]
MSYGIRNTLILILILLLMCGGGYLGLHLRYDEEIEVLAQQIEQKKKEFSKLEGYLADLDYYYEEIKTNQERLKSYPKILLPTVEIHQTYRYLEYLDRLGTFFNFTFVLADIKEKKGYAEAIYQLSGEGIFPKLAAFFMRLEKLKPIYRIDNFRMRSKEDLSDENLLQVDLQLTGLFSNEDRAKTFSIHSFRTQPKYTLLRYDPFMPLILKRLPPNSDNLPIVEKCNLIAITGNVAYIKDQSNNLLKMKAGDKIYLGYLANVNLNRGTVTFKMNRGGIKDTVVLNLNPTK